MQFKQLKYLGIFRTTCRLGYQKYLGVGGMTPAEVTPGKGNELDKAQPWPKGKANRSFRDSCLGVTRNLANLGLATRPTEIKVA